MFVLATRRHGSRQAGPPSRLLSCEKASSSILCERRPVHRSSSSRLISDAHAWSVCLRRSSRHAPGVRPLFSSPSFFPRRCHAAFFPRRAEVAVPRSADEQAYEARAKRPTAATGMGSERRRARFSECSPATHEPDCSSLRVVQCSVGCACRRSGPSTAAVVYAFQPFSLRFLFRLPESSPREVTRFPPLARRQRAAGMRAAQQARGARCCCAVWRAGVRVRLFALSAAAGEQRRRGAPLRNAGDFR